MRNQTKILLVGKNLRQLEKMLNVFWENGFKLLFASDVQEGFHVAQRNRPNLIICEFVLPGASGLDLCRMIRRDPNLCTVAFVFFGERLQESESLNEALKVGADDWFAEFFTPHFFVGKALWIIERKSSEAALKLHYQNLRQNQSQILRLIKKTSELIDNLDFRRKVEKPEDPLAQEFEKFMSQKLDFGLGMIGALANLMDDQVKALDIWENSFRGEPAICQEIKKEMGARVFYESSYN